MHQARDWILENVLFLDPPEDTSKPKRRSPAPAAPLAVVNEPATSTTPSSKFLQLFPCTLELRGRRSAFRLRCSKSPVDSVIVCSETGDQLRALSISTLKETIRPVPKKLQMLFAKDDSSFQLDVEFTTAGDCGTFCDALHALYGVEVFVPEAPLTRTKTLMHQRQQSIAQPQNALLLEGTGSVGEPLKLTYPPAKIEKNAVEAMKLRPFESVRIYVSSTLGGKSITFDTEGPPALENRKLIPLNILLAGRYVRAEAVLRRDAVKIDPGPLRATKGPILPDGESLMRVMEFFAKGSAVFSVSVVVEEVTQIYRALPLVPEEVDEFLKRHQPSDTLLCRLVASTRGMTLTLPDQKFDGLSLLWTEAILMLPAPVDDEGVLVETLSRQLAYYCAISFKDATGTSWLQLGFDAMTQAERNLIWLVSQYFLMNPEPRRMEKWEIDRVSGKTSDLARHFRDGWIGLDWNELATIAQTPLMYTENPMKKQPRRQSHQPSDLQSQRRQSEQGQSKKRKAKRKSLDESSTKKAKNKTLPPAPVQTDPITTTDGLQSDMPVTRRVSWSSQESSELSSSDH